MNSHLKYVNANKPESFGPLRPHSHFENILLLQLSLYYLITTLITYQIYITYQLQMKSNTFKQKYHIITKCDKTNNYY